MNLLDQVIDHINVTEPEHPYGFDITVCAEYAIPLIEAFNRGDCGFLYLEDHGFDGCHSTVVWVPDGETLLMHKAFISPADKQRGFEFQ